MSLYTITILIGIVLLLILLFVLRHFWIINNNKFERFPVPTWAFILFILFVFIPIFGQIILLSVLLTFSIDLGSNEVFSLTNIEGLTRDEYYDKSSKYKDRYNKCSSILWMKIIIKLKKFFNYNLNK